jgi:hypothetical protein
MRKPANSVSWLNLHVPSLKQRLERILAHMNWEYADLVAASGESRSVVSQWLGRGSKTIHSIGKMEAAERLEAATGFLALWIAKGIGPERADMEAKYRFAVADMVRHSATLREVARMQIRTRQDLTPEQMQEYLAAIDSMESNAQ